MSLCHEFVSRDLDLAKRVCGGGGRHGHRYGAGACVLSCISSKGRDPPEKDMA